MIRTLLLAIAVGAAIVAIDASPERRERWLGWLGLARSVCGDDPLACATRGIDAAPPSPERGDGMR